MIRRTITITINRVIYKYNTIQYIRLGDDGSDDDETDKMKKKKGVREKRICVYVWIL